MTTALLEPFESNFNFPNTAGWSIVAGRTGNCMRGTSGATNTWSIPAALASTTITMGFAWQVSDISTAARSIIQLLGNGGSLPDITLTTTTSGAIEARNGANTGTVLGTTATGLVVANTWYYVELSVFMSDTVGTVNLNIDGVSKLALTGKDTKAAGVVAFDAVRILGGAGGVTESYDDMYVAMGGGESFRGSQTLSALSAAANARQASRVGFVSGAAATTEIIRAARQAVRVAINPLGVAGVTVKAWNGSAWVDAPVKIWNGSAWVDAVAIKTWNGSAWV